MAAPKTTTQSQRDALKAEIAHRHARAQTQQQIALSLGISPRAVNYWLKKIDADAAALLEERAVQKRARLIELAELRKEAWEAWERSKESAVVEIEEQGSGVKGSTSKSVTRTEYQVGDASFLAQIQKAIEQERAMLGYDTPARTRHEDVPPIDWERVPEDVQVAFLEERMSLADVVRSLQPRD